MNCSRSRVDGKGQTKIRLWRKAEEDSVTAANDFAVIFDMDGVLLDSERVNIDGWKAVARDLGIEDIESVCYRFLGINRALSKAIFDEKYQHRFEYEDCWALVTEYFNTRCADGVPMKPGVREILEDLKSQEIPLAIASSTNIEVVEKELSDDGILDYFDQVIGGNMIRRSKPDPEIFLAAAEKLGFAPQRCYVIEDSFNGVRAVSAAGMHPIMVPDLIPPDEEMRKLAEAILPSLKEAKEYFRMIVA